MNSATMTAALLLVLVAGCTPRARSGVDAPIRGSDNAARLFQPAAAGPIDRDATPETRALFVNLRRLAGRQVMFGHQDDLAYGHTWTNQPGRSDVKEVAGSYPAVYGWDVSGLEIDAPANIDGVSFDGMRRWIAEGYGRGGVVTVSWHMANPESGRNAWDTTRAVAAILPGGARHEQYKQSLDRFAAFVGTLRRPGASGGNAPIPLVFRPFHEMSGSWFWWGGRNRTPEEYQRLWRFTVEYLRDTRQLHNLLYVYSTDVFASKDDYLTSYPGDAYVDVLGFDDYQSVKTPGTREVLARRLRDVVELADARGKVAAFTETGVQAIPDSAWWTGTLLPAIDHDSVTRRIAWVTVWRNAMGSARQRNHYFAPIPGHASAADFVRFRQHPLIAFEDELPRLYKLPAAGR